MGHTRRRTFLLLTAAAVLLGSLAAGIGTAVAAGESASPAADASAAGDKVIYKVGWTRQPDNLNPFIGFESPAFEAWYLTYDSLVGYDPATLSPMKGEDSTGLATDWTVSDDGLT
jgi:ABC-type oligopeptide transport system substrate-binding subunit